MQPKKFPAIPIVEASSNRVAGGFCATMDALSADELTLLAQLKELSDQAKRIKARMKTAGAEERILLEKSLEDLRTQARLLQEKRRQATQEKNIRLGHATVSIGRDSSPSPPL